MPHTLLNPLPIAVLISGNGSNLQAIIDSIAHEQLPATIKVVISNRDDAYGLERARKAGIPTEIVLRRDYPDRPSFDAALQACLERHQPQLIVLAGFMHILSAKLIERFHNQILNIHPSLLPKYPGMHTHQRVIEAGEKSHGATVHIVTAELDAGPILAQVSLEIDPNDSPESLQQRVHKLEHKLYPEVIRKYALGEFTELPR